MTSSPGSSRYFLPSFFIGLLSVECYSDMFFVNIKYRLKYFERSKFDSFFWLVLFFGFGNEPGYGKNFHDFHCCSGIEYREDETTLFIE